MIRGFEFAGVAAGIKSSGEPDVALMHAEAGATCAGVFTQNLVVAAPVLWCREQIGGGHAQLLVVNSGNANACTGEAGLASTRRMAELGAQRFGCEAEQVLVCSTGVIGQQLPMGSVESGILGAAELLHGDGLEAFARAIMTTDTRPKVRQARRDGVRVAGAAKGAGMIHPNMATMLGFVFTDAKVDAPTLQSLWARVVDRSFNAITVDGDTSTNDTALVFASGHVEVDVEVLEALLTEVAVELARDIVRDAEGATKGVEITVSGAADDAQARLAANAIALSPLVKTALHGEDPNWGRIIAAAGRSGASFEPEALQLWIGEALLYAEGRWQGPDAEAATHATMCTPEYAIRLDLGAGSASRTVFTCDFGAGYVRINADYRS